MLISDTLFFGNPPKVDGSKLEALADLGILASDPLAHIWPAEAGIVFSAVAVDRAYLAAADDGCRIRWVNALSEGHAIDKLEVDTWA